MELPLLVTKHWLAQHERANSWASCSSDHRKTGQEFNKSWRGGKISKKAVLPGERSETKNLRTKKSWSADASH